MVIGAIVLDYRAAHKTVACLRSLVSQGVHTVLIVDNSADALASEQLQDAVSQLQKEGIDYAPHVLDPGCNLGFGRGVNFALTHLLAQPCDAFLLLNNDASLAPGSVAHMIEALDTADLIGPAIFDDYDQPHPTMWYQRFFGLMTSRPYPGAFPYLSGCCLLFKRDLLISGKLFDEAFFMYGEDTALGWRMGDENKSIRCVDTAVVHHTGQHGLRECTLFYEYHTARAHVLLARKTRRYSLEIVPLLAAKCCSMIVRALLRCGRYRSAIPLQAFFLAWLPVDIRKT